MRRTAATILLAFGVLAVAGCSGDGRVGTGPFGDPIYKRPLTAYQNGKSTVLNVSRCSEGGPSSCGRALAPLQEKTSKWWWILLDATWTCAMGS